MAIMSCTSKSPINIVREALAVARKALPAYSHRNSPKTYTLHQHFAALVLMTFFKTDYRGIWRYLQDLADLRQAIGYKGVPHWTTLQKAQRRIFSRPRSRRLLETTVRRYQGRRKRVHRLALDSTGFDSHHVSSYFVRRRTRSGGPKQPIMYRHYPTQGLAVHCANHLVVATEESRGPHPDVAEFVPLLDASVAYLTIDTVLADAGYDSEANHRYARDTHHIRSVIPPQVGRPTSNLPTGRWRRLMKQRLDKHYCQYGQRWQSETVHSMIKRLLGSALSARSYHAQNRQMRLRAITHNILILYTSEGFLQSRHDPESDPESPGTLSFREQPPDFVERIWRVRQMNDSMAVGTQNRQVFHPRWSGVLDLGQWQQMMNLAVVVGGARKRLGRKTRTPRNQAMRPASFCCAQRSDSVRVAGARPVSAALRWQRRYEYPRRG